MCNKIAFITLFDIIGNMLCIDIYIDIGAKSEEDVLSMGVRIGDGLTWDSPLKTIKKNNTKAILFKH